MNNCVSLSMFVGNWLNKRSGGLGRQTVCNELQFGQVTYSLFSILYVSWTWHLAGQLISKRD